MTPEEKAIRDNAAVVYAMASGKPVAEVKSAISKDATLLPIICNGLRAISDPSPLADEIETLIRDQKSADLAADVTGDA